MSAKVMGHIWDLELPHNQLIVLLAYADHASHDGSNIYPSVGLMAYKTGYSERTIQRVTRELVKAGYLIHEGNTEYGTNHYRFDFEAGVKKSPYKGGDKMTGGDIAVSPGGRHNCVTAGGDSIVSPKPSLEIVKEPVVVSPTMQEADAAIFSQKEHTTAAAAVDESLSKVITAYERNIGAITPMIADNLKAALEEHSAETIIDAITEAINNNVRKWKYCAVILDRWKREGRGDNRKTATPAPLPRYRTMSEPDEPPTLSVMSEEDRQHALSLIAARKARMAQESADATEKAS